MELVEAKVKEQEVVKEDLKEIEYVTTTQVEEVDKKKKSLKNKEADLKEKKASLESEDSSLASLESDIRAEIAAMTEVEESETETQSTTEVAAETTEPEEQTSGNSNNDSNNSSNHTSNNSNSNSSESTNSNTSGNTNSNASGNSNSNASGNTNSNTSGNTNSNTSGNTNSDTSGNTNSNTSGNSNSNASGNSNSNSSGKKPEPKPRPAHGRASSSDGVSLLGTPDLWGGKNRSGFDCSGVVSWAYGQAGKSIPSHTGALLNTGTAVNYSQAQAGDLVFFTIPGGAAHVGIYVGGGQFIGSQSSTGVAFANMSSGYWKDAFNGNVRRIN